MECIDISENEKEKIIKLIKKLRLRNLRIDAMQSLNEENKLTKVLIRRLLKETYENIKYIRDLIQNVDDQEFTPSIRQKFEELDTLSNSTNNEDIENLYKCLNICTDIQKDYELMNKAREVKTIAKASIQSINSIDKLKIKVEDETRQSLETIKNNLQKLISSTKTDIKSIQININEYNKFAMQVWKEYLTKPTNKDNSEFRYLVHNLNKGTIKGKFSQNIVSTSLITNREMGLYRSGSSKYGLIINPKNIVSAEYRDSYTLNYSEFNEEKFCLEKPPIQLPQEIEKLAMDITVAENGELLNYEKANIYTEVVVDQYDITGIFIVTNGEVTLSPDYENAKQLADEYNLPLIELNICQERVKKGLEPMTEHTKKEFCRNVFREYSRNYEDISQEFLNHSDLLEEYSDSHYEILYQKCKNLLEKGNFSREDIMENMKLVILDDEANRWKQNGNIYALGKYIGKLSQDNVKYLFNQRFNFLQCKTFEEFNSLYMQLVKNINLMSNNFPNKDVKEFINNNFQIILENKQISQEDLKKYYDSGNFNLDTFIQLLKSEKTDIKENDFPETEEIIQEQRKNQNDVKIWKERFKSCYAITDKVPDNIKIKLIQIRTKIINTFKNLLRMEDKSKQQEDLDR